MKRYLALAAILAPLCAFAQDTSPEQSDTDLSTSALFSVLKDLRPDCTGKYSDPIYAILKERNLAEIRPGVWEVTDAEGTTRLLHDTRKFLMVIFFPKIHFVLPTSIISLLSAKATVNPESGSVIEIKLPEETSEGIKSGESVYLGMDGSWMRTTARVACK